MTVTIVDRDGERVRRLADDIDTRPQQPVRVVWDGRTDAGLRAPDGLYRMQVGLRRTGRTVVVSGSFNIDTTAPQAGRRVRHAADRRAGAGGVRDPRPRRRAPPRAALPRPAHRREPGGRGRSLPRPRRQPPRRLGRPRRRRARAAGHLHGRRGGPRSLRQRGHGAGRAAAGAGPGARQAGDHRAPDHRAAAARAGARRRARRVLRRLAPALVSLEHSPGRHRPAGQAGRRGAGAHARRPRAAGGARAPTCCRCAPAATARASRSSSRRPSGRGCSSWCPPSRGSASTRSTTTATACPTRSRRAGR